MDMVDTSSSLLTAEERVKVGGEDDVAAQSQTTAKKLMSSRDGGNTTQDEMDVVASTNESNRSITTSSSNLHYYDPQVISRYIQFYKNNGETLEQQTNHNHPSSSTEGDDAALPPKKKKPKRKSKKHIDPAVLTIRREIQFCCKENNLIRALQIFRMALYGQSSDNDGDENNVDENKLLSSSSSLVKLEPQTFYNLLNLCDGSFGNTDGSSGGGRIHVGTPKVTKDSSSSSTQQQKQQQQRNDSTKKESEQKITLQQRLIHAKQIHSLLTQLNIPCIEPAFTALIRLAVRVGDYDLAEQYLIEAEGTQQCKVKLRMYSSLLRGYCGDCLNTEEDGVGGGSGDKSSGGDDDNDGSSRVVKATQEGLIKALKVWKRMYDNSGGMSTGHPRYHETAAVQQVDSSSTTTNTATKVPLFGEGISPKISLSEYEYSSLLKCATALRDTKVAERVLSDIAESVSVPGLSTVEVMLRWFRSDRGATTKIFSSDTNVDEEVMSSALDNVTLPPREGEGSSVGPVTNDTGKGWNIYRNCTIDLSTGILYLGNPETEEVGPANKEHHQRIQYRLKPMELTQKAWKAMREMNSSIVVEGTVEGNISPFQGGGKGKKRPRGGDVVSKLHDDQSNNNNSGRTKDPNWRINHWKEFETFIENHPPYNIVIDGANVGYYNQAFRLGSSAPKHVDYRQIDGLVRHLLENSCSIEQHHIILFLHERHFSPKLLPQWANPIIKMWDGDEAPYDRLTVYRTPQGLNDDWYWMHAALINGGRDDKPSVLAITNDEMRDHHFQMTAQGYFLRWKERHQVHFDFGDWDRDLKRNKVLLQYPSIYSRRIQRVVGESSCDADVVTAGADAIVIPLPKKGDENRFVDGVHVADDGIPEEETYVVIEKVIS